MSIVRFVVLESATLNSILTVLLVTKAHYYMTQHLYKVITDDVLEYNILRSVSEPLSSEDLTRQSLITPLGLLLDEELHELQIYWTPTYLPYWADGVHNPYNAAHMIQNFLQSHIPTEDDPDEECNTPYPLPKHSKHVYQLPDIYITTYKKCHPNNPCLWM